MATRNVVTRYGVWLEAVSELLGRPHPAFPRAAVAALMNQTFEGAITSWNWAERVGFGFEIDRRLSGWEPRSRPADRVVDIMEHHPLVRWFALSQDPRPMSVGRVPRGAVARADFALLAAEMTPAGLEEQLSIPYRLDETGYRTFVLGRAGEDFSDEDLDLAGRIQPLLALLDRQVGATCAPVPAAARAAGLTSREVVVLDLLARGGTAAAIGRRLGISPRTVHRHLQHIYRKLGVDDRMRAVLTARSLQLIPVTGEAPAPRTNGAARGPDLQGTPRELWATTPLSREWEARCVFVRERAQDRHPAATVRLLEPPVDLERA